MSKKSGKRRLNPKPRKKPHQFTLPDGSTMTFRTREEMLRVRSLYEIFQLPGKDNKPQKTNMDVAVRMTSDNPLLKSKLTKAQQPIIDLKVIPTEEFEKKYKRTAAGDMKKVSSVNPYGKIKAAPKKKEEKKEMPPKNWVGPPYTEEELLPQNIRYTKALNNIQNTTCLTCTGTEGKYVAVNDCDGNGPYFFPCAIFENNTPTNAILGLPVSCVGPGHPYYYACQNPCWGSQWVPFLIDDCLQGWNECSSLKQDPVCITAASTCATPGQPVVSNIVDNFFVIGVDYTNPISITGPPKKIVPKIPVDYTQSNQPIPYDWACANPMTTYEPGYIPTDPAILMTTYPYSVIAVNTTLASSLEMIQYHTANFPSIGCQTKRYCNIAASQNPEPTGCVETRSGAYTPHFFIWQIAYFNPGKINVDPATGTGGVLSSQAATYYDTWTEMVDDLITAGEYVGNNTDTLIDLWNAGIQIAWTTHLCVTCPVAAACATPNQ